MRLAGKTGIVTAAHRVWVGLARFASLRKWIWDGSGMLQSQAECAKK